MTARALRRSALLIAAATLACENAGVDRVLSITAAVDVTGFAYIDRNGDRNPSQGDSALGGVAIRLVPVGSRDTAARGVTAANGDFAFPQVPVGRYEVVALDNPTLFGDSISVVRIDTSLITLTPADTLGIEVAVAISFPIVTIAEARALAVGTKVFVEAIVLNQRDTFGDSTVHVVTETGAIRVTRMRTAVLPGDSVRLLARRERRDGHPTLDDPLVEPLGQGSAPPVERLNTVQAGSADGGRLDAALIRLIDVTISDTATVAGDYVLVVSDSLGTVDVVFDQDAGLTRTPYVPMVLIDVTGLLVPTGAGTWRIKPRTSSDVVEK
ncbi:MAG TPA: hypothetical protein VGA37_10965 [Gemmatimonadales bacterium]